MEMDVRLIYYSLARAENSQYDQQWIQSIRSLRSYNRRIPVCLFVFNGVSAAIEREAERWRVMLLPLGDYRDWLQGYHPRGQILAMYPTLHKFLVLSEADTTGLRQALYLDCDTFFFDDPELLFEQPDPCHWCAREEAGSRLSPLGYDPSNINEELIARIASAEGLRWVGPFNSGVCLLNNDIWRTFRQLRSTFFDVVWQLLVGQEYWRTSAPEHSELRDAVMHHAAAYDIARAFPYPSSNSWILEEMALWLTMGHIRDLSQRMFERNSVAQGYECVEAMQNGRRPIVAHYFSYFQTDFFRYAPRLR